MPTQTPASRKFVLPSSTAPSRSQKQHGHASQFSRPAHASSSPYTRTPFSSTARKQNKDDIVADDPESDNEDEDYDLHSRPTQPRPNPVSGQTELSEEDDSAESPPGIISVVPTQPNQQHKSQGHIFHPPKRRKTSHTISESINDDDVDQPGSPSSQVRASNEIQLERPETLVSHSSPLHPARDNPSPIPPQHHSSSPHSSPPTSPAHDFETPKHRKSRFYNPLPSSTHAFNTASQSTVYPSFQSRLLASTPTNSTTNRTTDPGTGTGTKTSPGPPIRGMRPNIDLTLPDAFSPSRKRGAREYIYGGIAETVRGWVVDMATIVADQGGPPVKSMAQRHPAAVNNDDDEVIQMSNTAIASTIPKSGNMQLLVKDVILTDNNSRFVLIRSQPHSISTATHHQPDGQQHGTAFETEAWLLINTDPQSRTSSVGTTSRTDLHSRLTGVQPGKIVNVKGGESMNWELKVAPDMHLGSDIMDSKRPGKCRAAVLWDVV